MKPTLLLLAISALLLAGCGSSSDERPADAAPIPVDTAPTKVPTTVDEKIAAIEKSSLPADQKRKAIAAVQSGGSPSAGPGGPTMAPPLPAGK